jgi:hypothetical protein
MKRNYRRPLVGCIGNWDKKPLSWRAMMLSLSWNIGIGGTRNSTAACLGRAGEFEQIC